jgi:hypothetical protein
LQLDRIKLLSIKIAFSRVFWFNEWDERAIDKSLKKDFSIFNNGWSPQVRNSRNLTLPSASGKLFCAANLA